MASTLNLRSYHPFFPRATISPDSPTITILGEDFRNKLLVCMHHRWGFDLTPCLHSELVVQYGSGHTCWVGVFVDAITFPGKYLKRAS